MSGMQIAQRSDGVSTRWAKALRLGALAGGLMVAGFGLGVPAAVAASTTTVDLGQASTYAVFSGLSVGNTVNAPLAPHTTLRGDLGVKPLALPTGFPPGVVTGKTEVGTPAAAEAHADLVAAYDNVAGRTGGTPLAGDLAGLTLAPGLHSSAAAVANTGMVTLDAGGDPNAVFVFKIGGALTMAAGAKVTLTNGARAANVFWQVNGAGGIGANAKFAGTLMALDAIGVGAGTEVNGRALARNGAVSLDSNEFYSVPPQVAIDGGPTASTTDTTPTISGTTDVVAPGVVTVTIDGQTLTATPSEGAWSVTSAILANGSYPVVASASDAAGNQTSVAQQLTVDTVLPVVTMNGGPSVTTNDPTPTIAGTSDVAPGTIVRVTVDSQALTALVQSSGSWNVTPTALTDGTRTVTASVSDPAGNEGTDSQLLTVDTAPPAVTIAGGANALTNDATPNISGTADVASGTTVTVTVADQELTGLVQSSGAWSVTAATLSDGPHRVVMSVSDAAGNRASATQTLTTDTVAPVVAITGGATATTKDVHPTIAGTSDAAPGTTVTVSIAGQTMTTLLQDNGTWNATPDFVGEGTWPVVASASDPAGNVGSARQTLTIDSVAPQTSIDSGPSGTIDNRSASFGFSSSEAASTFECKLDGPDVTGGSYGSCSSPKSHTSLGDGNYTFSVRASDSADNTDATPATRSFTIDVPEPVPPPDPVAPPPPPPVAPPPPAPVAPPPAAPVAPPPPAPAEVFPAKLQVERAGVSGGRLDVLARITARATGDVDVRYESSGKTTRFTAPIKDGTVRIDRALPSSQRRKTTGIVTMTYEGNERVRSDEVRLRAASGKAVLRRGTTRIDDKGQLRVTGTTSTRARGVVRVRLGYTATDASVRFLHYQAKINNGKWSLTEALPSDGAKAGGQLSIQYTGYEPRLIRGEQLAKAVAP
ncbi:MAG: Ig-like domain-containing protein [Actinomycetota bacterium]|nr:Ig-like domain-containing protein [Actinomycetota bacterium]